jgi:hypothetical protein
MVGLKGELFLKGGTPPLWNVEMQGDRASEPPKRETATTLPASYDQIVRRRELPEPAVVVSVLLQQITELFENIEQAT